MIEYYLAGAFLRGSQILIDASIWIACGCFIAAIIRNMVGPEKTRAVFGNNTRYGLIIGWAVGMLLPVCSLGVIPVVREMHRVGVRPGTIIAFGLTAPLFNPLSILYGLSLSDPIAIVVFSAAAMIIVTGIGAIWEKLFCRNMPDPSGSSNDQQAVPVTGIRRSLAVIHSATKELSSWSILFIGIGILASVTISVLFQHGSLHGAVEPDNAFAPISMALYVTPVYSTPLLAMSQIGGMFQHGNSVGAAFSLLILGAGVNLGIFCWFGTAYGVRRVFAFFILLLSFTVAIAYTIDKPLYPKGVDPAGHTHAFDIYTHPYLKDADYGVGLLTKAGDEVWQQQKKLGLGGVYPLLILGLIGIGFRVVESRWNLNRWYETQSDAKVGWDIALPGWVVGLFACISLVILSILGTFVYYPAPDSLFEDLTVINTNCVIAAKTGDWEGVEKWVGYCDDLSRRLEVGVILREWSISEFRQAKAKVYRDKLDELRDNIQAGQTENANAQAMDLHRALLQLKKTFREED